MIKNYLKIAIRSYLRNKIYTAISLLSLVIGLFVAYLSIEYIRFEYSYDNFNKESENIYRLARTYRDQDYSVIGFKNWSDSNGSEQVSSIVNLKQSPNISDAAQFIISTYEEYIGENNSRVQSKGILYTNTASSFANIFTFKTISGSFANFASGTNKVVLNLSTAQKVFGDKVASFENQINKSIRIGAANYVLAAVIEDLPKNAHFDFNVAVNAPRINYWGSRVYVKTNSNVSLTETESQINSLIKADNPRLAKDELYSKHFLQNIKDIHLKSNILYESKKPGNALYIKLIGLFGLFIVFITLFNYANLSLALKSKQSKAIGVRKALGSGNFGITTQLLVDGMVMALIALPLVAIALYFSIPYFNQFLEIDLQQNIFSSPLQLLVLFVLAIFIGFIATLTPALLFASKSIVLLFKEDIKANNSEFFSIRKYLVVSQFAILIIISSVSFFVSKQINFIKNKDVGFNKEGIIYTSSSPEKTKVFQDKLKLIPGIKYVGNGSTLGVEEINQMTYRLQNRDEIFDDATQLYFDYEAIKGLGIKANLLNEEAPVLNLINRTAAEKLSKVLGVSVENLKGTTIVTEPEYVNESTGQVGIPFVIDGVFEDINMFSLRQKVEPYFMRVVKNYQPDGRSIIAFDKSNSAVVLDAILKNYESLGESFPLEIEFLDNQINQLYKQDIQTGNLLLIFTIIAVLLSSLGILGISIFLAMARTKEFGIRKVLGASVVSIIKISTKEYVILTAVAYLIAWPLAWYAAKTWLSSFAFRVALDQWVFAVFGLLTFLFAAIIVGAVSYKAASVNPVESLKNE